MMKMACEEVWEFLPETGDPRVREHLQGCPSCAATLSLLRELASLPVPPPPAGWAEGLPAAVLAEAAAREQALMAKVASLPVPDPGPGFFDALPGRVRDGISARAQGGRLARSIPWWWAGGAAAAAAAVALFVIQPGWQPGWLAPSPLTQPADEELVLAINAAPLSFGHATDLASAGEAGQDWLGGLDEVDLQDLEETEVYRAPVPGELEQDDDPAFLRAPARNDGRTSGSFPWVEG